jgi:hypothetical protein
MYPLKKKNFEDLRIPSVLKPYLFVLFLPKNEDDFLIHSINELIIRRCMYWLDLRNLPSSDNEFTVTVPIPKTQFVSPDAVDSLLTEIAKEGLA